MRCAVIPNSPWYRYAQARAYDLIARVTCFVVGHDKQVGVDGEFCWRCPWAEKRKGRE